MARPVDIVVAELDELAAAEPGMAHAPEILRVRNRVEAMPDAQRLSRSLGSSRHAPVAAS